MKTLLTTLYAIALYALTAGLLPASFALAQTAEEATPWRIVKDVKYLGDDRAEKLDLYLPNDDSKQFRPAVVIVHGGGWHGGDKFANREQNIGKTLASAGFVCASVNYRLSEKSDDLAARLRQVFPGNLEDCRTAVRFLRHHAKEYRIDPDHIGAIGGSAGGHLVALMAVVDDDVALGLTEKPRYAEFSSRVQAVVPMYGVHDVLLRAQQGNKALTDEETKLLRAASPVTYITADDPPTLILHGTKDDLVPVEQSEILQKQLTAAKVSSELLVIEGAPHSFHLQPQQKDLRPVVIKFFNQHLTSSGVEPPRVTVKKCEDFRVNGKGDHDAWQSTDWVDLKKRPKGTHDYAARFKMLYSDSGVYVLFDGSDRILTATMKEDFLDLWNEDVFECFFWTSEKHTVYFEYEISPLGYELPIMVPNLDGRFLGWRPWHYEGKRKIQKKVSATGGVNESMAEVKGWRAEVFIPHDLLTPLQNVPPKSGTQWRANFYRVDYDDKKVTGWDWARVGPSFHDFKNFGTLVFE